MPEARTVHASCVSVGGRGVLLMGPPGSGKSSLALRLIDEPGYGIAGTLKTAVLVADDQVMLRRDAARVIASAPERLAGWLEIRGIGIVPVPAIEEAEIAMVVSLAAAASTARLPEASDTRFTVLERELPHVTIDAALAAAPSRLRAALDLL